MKKMAMGLLVLCFSGLASAQSGSSSESVTIHDLNKTVELCRSLDHKTIKIDCAKASQACAGSKDKKACLEQQAK